MPTIKFTSRTCDGLRPADQRIDYFDEHTPGLHLRVTPSGVKSWSYIYRSNRRQRRLTLGRYPAVGLKDARDKALKAQAQIADDIDPALVRAEARDVDTFGAVAESYLERHARKFKKSWKEDQRILNKDVLPYWRHLPAKEITRRLVRDVVERISDRGAQSPRTGRWRSSRAYSVTPCSATSSRAIQPTASPSRVPSRAATVY